MDYSKLSDAELEAIANEDYSKLSESTLRAIASTEPESRSMIDSLKRGIGVGARSVMQGINDIPNMIVDPFVNLYNLATKSNVPTFEQRQEQVYNQMNLPTPVGSEKYAQTGIRALSGAGGIGLAARGAKGVGGLLASELSANPATQATAALAGQGAIQAAQEGGVDNSLALMGVGMMGGAMGGGMGAIAGNPAQRIAQGGKALVRPATQAGRETIVGTVLNNLLRDKESALQNIQDYKPLIAGSNLPTAAVTRDIGLAGAESAIRGLDTSNKFGQAIAQANQARSDQLLRMSGRKADAVDLAKQKRKEITDPMREVAFQDAQPVDLTPIFDRAMTIVSGPAGARQDVEKAIEWAMGRLSKAGDDPRRLYEVRKDINDALNGKYDKDVPSLKLAKGQLKGLVRTIDDTLEESAPGYRDYMTKYAKISKGIGSMELIGDIANKTMRGQADLQTGQPIITASTLRNQLASRQDVIKETLSNSQQAMLTKIVNDIDRGMASTAPGVKSPGSDTFKNLSMGNFIGRVFSEGMSDNPTVRTITRPLDWLYSMPNQAMTDLLIDAMLDPQLARDLIRKADTTRIEKVSDRLKQRANQLGYGSMYGIGE